MNIELAIAWPALLHNVAPMRLVLSGRIVRTDGSLAAVHIAQHEFRTAGKGERAQPSVHRSAAGSKARRSPMAGIFGTLE